jgi:hypothetical protein
MMVSALLPFRELGIALPGTRKGRRDLPEIPLSTIKLYPGLGGLSVM